MVTIILPPELEQAYTEQAEQQGTTAELLVLDVLHREMPYLTRQAELPPGVTLVDALADYIGAISTKDKYPAGSMLSQDTGRKFAQGMAAKHRQGKL